jgi:hypothetical protein
VRGLLIAGLTAALIAPARADDDEYAKVHTVAVVSTLGASLHWETTGMTRFDYLDEPLRLDWSVDDYVERAIAGMLRGRFVVTGKAPPRNLFEGDSNDSQLSRTARMSIAALPEAAGVDAYIVVRPSKLPNQDDMGIAVSHHSGAFGRELTDLRSSFVVEVFDAKTGERIDYGTANSPLERAQWGLVERCDEAIWANKVALLTAQQKAKIVDAVATVIDKSLPFALDNAKLISDDAARDRATLAASEPGSTTCHPL